MQFTLVLLFFAVFQITKASQCSQPLNENCYYGSFCQAKACANSSSLKSRNIPAPVCAIFNDITKAVAKANSEEGNYVSQYCSSFNRVTTTSTPVQLVTATIPTTTIIPITNVNTHTLSTTVTTTKTDFTTNTLTSTVYTEATETITETEPATTITTFTIISPSNSKRGLVVPLAKPDSLKKVASGLIGQVCSCLVSQPSTLVVIAPTRTTTVATTTSVLKSTMQFSTDATITEISSTTTTEFETILTTTPSTTTQIATGTTTVTNPDNGIQYCPGIVGCSGSTVSLSGSQGLTFSQCRDFCANTNGCVSFQYEYNHAVVHDDPEGICITFNVPSSQVYSAERRGYSYCSAYALFDLQDCPTS